MSSQFVHTDRDGDEFVATKAPLGLVLRIDSSEADGMVALRAEHIPSLIKWLENAYESYEDRGLV